MPPFDQFWKYAQSDWPAPILSIRNGVTKTDAFAQLIRIGLVQEGQRQQTIQCPLCWEPCGEPLASSLPDGTMHFMLACPNCGGVEVTADELRNWRIHFSALPGMLAAHLGMREPQQIVQNTLWKLGRYNNFGDIWMARWLRYPEAKDWLAQVPRTPETILLYLGPPPDFTQLTGMPQSNIIDVSEILDIDDNGLRVDIGPVDAALRRSENAPVTSSAFAFRKKGDYWRLVFGGKTAMVKHTIGMLYIHYLLEIAPKQVSTIQLRQVANPEFQPHLLGSAGEELDNTTLKQLHKRLGDIDAELDEAKDHQNFGRQSDLVEEQESLKEQLHSSVGLRGRIRKADDDLERNRKTVSNAISTAIKKITAIHSELGQHLKTHISSGDHCAYRPEPGMAWST
jgi:hypothetical protein